MYKTQNGWTKKTTIEQIRAKVIHQSVAEDGHCVYRDGKGSACALGAFIPDELYYPALDLPFAPYPAIFDVSMPLPRPACLKMQQVHDTFTGPPDKVADAIIKWIEANVSDS